MLVTPLDEAELAGMVAAASGPLAIRGGGTRNFGHAEGQVLCTGGLSGIELYEPGALTMVVRAGTPLRDVEAALAAEGQRLAFEPMDHRGMLGTGGEPTIGGVVAGNVSGPRRVQIGACRDFVLGVRFVDGRGVLIKSGGRVMKNVTGYDLVKLMAGSFGTLGVLSEVALKVLPRPEAAATVVLSGLTESAAVRAMSAALGSPFEVTGAAHPPVGPQGRPVTLLRVEGSESSVTYRAGRLVDLLSDFGESHVEADPETVTAQWTWVRDVEPFHGARGDVWRISVKPTDGPEIAARLDASGVLFDWGGGLIWALLPEGVDARARLGDFAGHATLVRASAATRARIPTFQPEAAPLAAISGGLREKFDPRGILNPGLMG